MTTPEPVPVASRSPARKAKAVLPKKAPPEPNRCAVSRIDRGEGEAAASPADAREVAAGLTEALPWQPSKCRVPMWAAGSPAGFCDAPAFGHQLPSEQLYYERASDFSPGHRRPPYCPGHACPNHGGPRADEPRVFQDGYTEQGRQMWCAVLPDFVNLQESPAGFDGNPMAAKLNLGLAVRSHLTGDPA